MKRVTITASLLIAATLILLACVPAFAAEPPAAEQPLALSQVALFKNGLAFFIGQVECPANQSDFNVSVPTAPAHGTFWVSYPSAVAPVSLVAKQVESGQATEVATVADLLAANPGRRVRLVVADKEIDGVIRYVTRSRDVPPPDPYAPGRELYTASARPGTPVPSSLLVLDTQAGELSLDPKLVTQATFLEGKANHQLVEHRPTAVLHVRLAKPANGQKLSVSFLGKGLTWAPSYLVDITQPDQAKFSAQALVVNDACELPDVTVQLVTGFPHLLFADVVSPVALKENLAQFLQALPRRQSERGRADILSNVMSQSVEYVGPQGRGAMPAYSAAEMGQTAEDLFFYPAGSVRLAKNEVAYIPLFTETTPYQHIYQWEIPDYVNPDGDYLSRSAPTAAAGDRQEVWHSVRLRNTTNVPWTTAPGQTVKNGSLLGQDTLSYTPARAQTTLRITQAIGVKAEQREFETERKRQALEMYGSYFDLVTLRGELAATNFQDKPITLEITKTLSGELQNATPEPRAEKLATGLRGMNGLLRLTWTLDLPPGQRQDVTYVYKVYVRR